MMIPFDIDLNEVERIAPVITTPIRRPGVYPLVPARPGEKVRRGEGETARPPGLGVGDSGVGTGAHPAEVRGQKSEV